MKKIFLLALVVSFPAFADVIVIADKDGRVYTMSEKDDTEVPAGYVKSVVRGKTIEKLSLNQDPSMYDFKNDRFSLSSVRVLERKQKEEQAAIDAETLKSAKESSRAKLAALGLSDVEIAAITGEK